MGYIKVYRNGNCNGFPFASMEIAGSTCMFYDNGNCNGIPEQSVSGVEDIRDVIEFMFQLFVRKQK